MTWNQVTYALEGLHGFGPAHGIVTISQAIGAAFLVAAVILARSAWR